MWLITTFLAAIIITAFYIVVEKPERYKLGGLSLMLWGASLMILVDHIIGYAEGGGPFLELTTGGIISNGLVLGIVMLIPLFTVWEAGVLLQNKNFDRR